MQNKVVTMRRRVSSSDGSNEHGSARCKLDSWYLQRGLGRRLVGNLGEQLPADSWEISRLYEDCRTQPLLRAELHPLTYNKLPGARFGPGVQFVNGYYENHHRKG